jgi:hypothetical protein
MLGRAVPGPFDQWSNDLKNRCQTIWKGRPAHLAGYTFSMILHVSLEKAPTMIPHHGGLACADEARPPTVC